MFFNILRNADCFKKMIFLSSGAVYDTRFALEKVSEDFFDQRVPGDEHGFSKYVCAQYAGLTGRVIELRLFGVFGQYEDYPIRFISNAICKALYNLPITIRQNRKFDYFFIDDLMPVLEHFLSSDIMSGVFNVTPDESVELLTIAETVRKVSDGDLPIIIASPGLGPEYSGSNSRLRKEMPRMSLTGLEQAVQKLFNWYNENLKNVEKSFLLYDK